MNTSNLPRGPPEGNGKMAGTAVKNQTPLQLPLAKGERRTVAAGDFPLPLGKGELEGVSVTRLTLLGAPAIH